METRRQKIDRAVGHTDRLIAKAEYNETDDNFLNFLEDEGVLQTYMESTNATDEEMSSLLSVMQDYINSRKLDV